MTRKLPSNLLDLDPSVAAAIGLGDRRAADAALPRDDRARLVREREKIQKRNRYVVDLDPDIQRRLNELAIELRCPASGLVNLALDLFLNQVGAEEIDLQPYLAPTKSMRYECTVKPPSQNLNNSPPRDTPSKK